MDLNMLDQRLARGGVPGAMCKCMVRRHGASERRLQLWLLSQRRGVGVGHGLASAVTICTIAVRSYVDGLRRGCAQQW